MSTLDKHTQVYDPSDGKWKTKEQYNNERDPGFIDLLSIPFFLNPYNLTGLPKVDLGRVERNYFSLLKPNKEFIEVAEKRLKHNKL